MKSFLPVFLVALLLLSLSSCGSPREEVPSTPAATDRREPSSDDFSQAIALDSSIEELTKLRPRSEELILTLSWIDADIPDYVIARVKFENKGTVESLVVPIGPASYHLETRSDGGIREPLLRMPPLDPPMLNVSDLTKLHPRNSVYADFKVPRDEVSVGDEYRVVVAMYFRQSDSATDLRQFKHESKWERLVELE